MSGQNLTPEEGILTVQIYVVAPDEANTKFEGYIRVINIENPNDFNLIPIYLTTPINDRVAQGKVCQFLSEHPLLLFWKISNLLN
jgi:hypothetical protein